MIIRRATPADAAFIAKKVLQAITLQEDIDADAIEELAVVCAQDDTLYSYCHALIACVDNRAVGLALAYPGADYHAMRARTFPQLKYFEGTNPEQMPDETCEGEFYLDSLAVEADYRRQGIGRALLQTIKQKAQELGLQASLLVEPMNERALRVYASEGFVPCELRPAFGHTYRIMRVTNS